jgi:uncharacterized membrane protein
VKPEAQILFWWLMFGGSHLLGSTLPVRTTLIRALGLRWFKALYSLVALATFLPLCFIFFANRHAGGAVFDPPPWLQYPAQALMLVAIVILAQGVVTPGPLSTMAEMSGRYPGEARGVQRVTRHPQNLGFGLFGLAHCLVNPFVGDLLFFGGFAVYGVLSGIHQDRRNLAAGHEAAKRFVSGTSFTPFGAIVAGRQHFAPREYNVAVLAASTFVFVILRVFHASLFGGFAGQG